MRIHKLSGRCLLALPVIVFGVCATLKADGLTPTEKSEINAGTPGLFAKSDSFYVDFTQLKDTEYSFPVPGGKVSASRRGLDICAAKGAEVKAMFSGKVRLAWTLPSHGNVVVVRHGNGLETVYGGNAKNLVKAGDLVAAGQTIATVGEKGGKGLLLFEIMVNGCNINPRTLIHTGRQELYRHVYKFTKRGRTVAVAVEDNDAYSPKDGPVDIGREFTADEQSIVSTATPGLFAKSGSITIDFSRYGENDWRYPLPGAKVISNYGGRRGHTGVDLKTKPNDSIYAAFEGRVRFARRYGGYGNAIVIRHASGLETLYSHNSVNLARVGGWVKAGQPIALTGRTGHATTEHLHFEIRVNGKAYDPALIFDHDKGELKKVRLVVRKSGRASVSRAE